MFRSLKKLILVVSVSALVVTPSQAMFVQPDWLDPTQPGVGTNRYAYSHNDPINKMDPNGNFAISLGIAIGIGIGLIAGGWAVDNAVDYSDDNQLNGSKGLGITNELFDATEDLFDSNTVYSESDDGDEDESDGDDDDDEYDNNEDPSGEKNNRLGKDGDNKRQNNSFRAAVREIERQLGRSISRSEQRDLHDHITGQDYSYGDIVDEGVDMLGY